MYTRECKARYTLSKRLLILFVRDLVLCFKNVLTTYTLYLSLIILS